MERRISVGLFIPLIVFTGEKGEIVAEATLKVCQSIRTLGVIVASSFAVRSAINF